MGRTPVIKNAILKVLEENSLLRFTELRVKVQEELEFLLVKSEIEGIDKKAEIQDIETKISALKEESVESSEESSEETSGKSLALDNRYPTCYHVYN